MSIKCLLGCFRNCIGMCTFVLGLYNLYINFSQIFFFNIVVVRFLLCVNPAHLDRDHPINYLNHIAALLCSCLMGREIQCNHGHIRVLILIIQGWHPNGSFSVAASIAMMTYLLYTSHICLCAYLPPNVQKCTNLFL